MNPLPFLELIDAAGPFLIIVPLLVVAVLGTAASLLKRRR